MTRRWWVFVTVFIISASLFFGGFVLENSALVLAGILISVVLFFNRKYLQ